MNKILDYKYNKFDIIQLDESDIERLAGYMKENEIKLRKYEGCVSIALEYNNIKFVNVDYIPRGAAEKSPSKYIALFPDRIIHADCWTGKGDDGYMTGGISGTAGDALLDELFAQAAYYTPIYEETTFAWLIEKQSDGSEGFMEYGDDYERIRCEIIDYEQSMKKKYFPEDMITKW